MVHCGGRTESSCRSGQCSHGVSGAFRLERTGQIIFDFTHGRIVLIAELHSDTGGAVALRAREGVDDLRAAGFEA